MILDLASEVKKQGNPQGNPYNEVAGLVLSATGFLAQQVVNFRNGEADMGCLHRTVRVAVAVPALVACSVLALAETVLRFALGILIGVVALMTCCCCDDFLFGLAIIGFQSSLACFDASLRSIGSVFANIFTSCKGDHKFEFHNIQFPCAFNPF